MDVSSPKEFFLIAKVNAVFGTEGFVSILSFSDDNNRFFELNSVFIDVFGEKRKFLVEEVKKLKNNIVLKFVNFNSGQDVDFLVGCEIFVDRKDSIILEKDSFFVHDLIGSEVFLADTLIGTLQDVISLPTNDIYAILTPEGKELLIPAVKEYVLGFNNELNRLDLTSESRTLLDDEN